ncbi:MAG: hypothetical protein CMH38_16695 [Microbacterium sp.]|uniref:TetR/AcrR family transcriptional regulator n=1 Tax=Microbacterium sp. TaxID=51671 RepID=UPI000C65234D|nr:TetR/AcrR family transcriptional regulator [Microbacterium sp.]MAY51523.1 hypothetical protein [Microbacterium sp.]HAS33506.1 hypothetical protein [Microbacterium sp.]HBR88127.1 hypothetical protein [Microbacterium sp.]
MGQQLINEGAGLRARAKAEVNRRISEATARLLAEREFDEVTTREIAQQAGIGEATLFRYVSSKEQLLAMVYGDQMDELIERVLAADERAETMEQTSGLALCARVKAIYRARADFYLQNPGNASRYLRQAFDVNGPDRERTMTQGDRLIARTTHILESGQRAGLIIGEVNALLVAQNCHGIFIHEVDRTPTRGFAPETIWERVSARLDAQLMPLAIPSG